MSLVRRGSAVFARALLVVLVASMLAGAASVRTTRTLALVFVVDVSGSARRFAETGVNDEAGRALGLIETAERLAARVAGSRDADDLVGLVAFDAESIAVATPTRADLSARSLDVARSEGTNIEQALRRAAALIPPDATGRLVLISDGNETAGAAARAAQELATNAGGPRTTIDVVPLAYSVGAEAAIESVDAPPVAPTESSISVRVTLNATAPSAGTLRLFREGAPVDLNADAPGDGRRITLEAGRNIERVQVELDSARVHRFEAVYEPDPTGEANQYAGDTHIENNRGSAFTVTPGRGSILIVDPAGAASPGTAPLADALGSDGARVEITSPEGLATDMLALQAHDLIVLNNIPAESLGESRQRLLAEYVSELGGGLVMVGGEDSFGAGGWKGTPIEPVLPVRLDLPEQLVQPEAAVVFILDKSGSMSQRVGGSSRRQQEIANEAAAAAIATLDAKDLVGVVAFNRGAQVIRELGPNDAPEQTAERVRSISSGGGTDLLPAMEWARDQMRSVEAKLKHVIVLSDGASLNEGMLPQLATEMRESGVKISTIGVGDGADLILLQSIANEGGGRFYRVTNPSLLPRIFLRAVRVVRKPLIREGLFTPIVAGDASPLTEGLSDPPKLDGMVLTQPRETGDATVAMLAPSGEPLLAHWNAGLGRVAAWTSDSNLWAERWLDWPGYRVMWANIARYTARPPGTREGDLGIVRDGNQLNLRYEAFDENGDPRDLLSVDAMVYAPDGSSRRVALSQTGPGVYETAAPASETGSHIVVVRPRQGTRPLTPMVGGVSISSGLEYRELRSNIDLLREISETTGGRLLSFDATPEELFDRAGVPERRVTLPIWRTLLLWTFAVMLLDVGTRRVAWDRLMTREQIVRDDVERAATGTLSKLRKRPEKRDGSGGSSLGDDDVAEIVRAEAKRRRAARRARLESMRTGADEPESSESARKEETVDDAGLLAAKRRARQRFEEEEIE